MKLHEKLHELVKRYEKEGTAAEVAYATLRHAIMSGQLPPGTRLRADELALEMGFSRTPIRESFRKLEAHELVDIQPRNGPVVREFTEQQLLEIYFIREALEGMSAHLAAENITKVELMELEQIVSKMQDTMHAKEFDDFKNLTISFHQLVNRASRNQRLTKLLDDLQDIVVRFHPSTFVLEGRLEKTLKEHQALLAAIEGRDSVAAERIARQYRRETMELRIRLYQETSRPNVLKAG
ncbi:MAG: GntR family transcriptional regulator [Rhodospirillales bacterium]